MSNEYDEILQSAAKSPTPDDYDAMIAADADQPRQRLRASMFAAEKGPSPDEYGKAKQLERKTGVPAPIAARNLPEVKLRADLNEFDELLRTSPVLARQLQMADFASLSRDDLDNLSQAEFILGAQDNPQYSGGMIGGPAYQRYGAARPLRGPKPTAGSVTKGLLKSFPQGLEKARQGIRLQFADLFGFDTVIEDAMRERRRVDLEEAATTPDFDSLTAQGLYGGGVSTLQVLPGVAASVATRSPAPVLSALGLQTEADAYGKYRERGATPGMAFLGATAEGSTEVLTEMLPMGFLVGKLGKVGAGQFLTGLLAREVPTEQIATFVQDAIDTSIANPDKTWGEFFAERPERGYETFLATLVQASVMGAGNAAMRRFVEDDVAVRHAEETSEALAQLAEIAKASKLRERDPQSFAEFVDQAAAEGPVQDVYVDARTFAQAVGEALPEVLAASPSVAAQFEEAARIGGDLRIPVGEYAANIAASDMGAALLQHLRTSPDAMSLQEAKTFMQEQAETFKADAERMLAEREFTDAIKESGKVVEQEILAQLEQRANRFTSDVNKAYAKLLAAFYTVNSQRLRVPITPEEMYVRYATRVQGEEVTGRGVMDQLAHHGTNASFEVFDPSKEGTGQGFTSQVPGVWFTANKGMAKAFGRNVITAELGLEKPFTISAEEYLQRFLYDGESPQAFRAQLEAAGHDGILIKAAEEYKDGRGPSGTEEWGYDNFVVFDPAKIKPVANAKEKGYTAEHGQSDRPAGTDAQREELHATVGGGRAAPGWARATRIRGKDGRPAAVYRGAAHALRPEHFDLGALGHATGRPSSGLGVWFTISEGEAASYGSVETFNLDMRNPLVVKVDELPGFDTIEEAHAWREKQRAAGYDGLLITAKHLGGRTHLVAFTPESVVVPTPVRSFEQGEREKQLIVQHNITADNLLHALRMGGIAVPSLAITKANDSITGFGEITLIGPSEMANPRGYARTKVFGADIYSPRYPRISYKFDAAAQKPLAAVVHKHRELTGVNYFDLDQLQKEGARYLEGHPAVMAEVLSRNGVSVERVQHEERFKANDATRYNMQRAIDQHNLREQLADYSAGLMREMAPQERIFMGFTYGGNRRYKAHTLENVVRILKKELRGGESSGNIYGVGQLRSKFAPQFRSITAIQKAADRIVTDEQFEEVKKEVGAEFFALSDALKPYYSHGADSFRYTDTVMALIEDSARMGLARAAKEYGFTELPDDARQQVFEFITRLRNMPTEYFEAKILRGVGINEFAAAVVPEGTNPEVLDALKRAGVEVATYKKGDEAARKKAVADTAFGRADRVMFQETIDNDTGKPDARPPFYSVLERQIEAAKMKVAPAAQWKSFINGLSSKGVKKEEIMLSGVMDWLDIQEGNTRPTYTHEVVDDTGEVRYAAGGEFGDGQRAAENWMKSVSAETGTALTLRRVEVPAVATSDRVTRDQVLDYLRENNVRVEEKILGEPAGTAMATVEEVDDADADADTISDEEIAERAQALWEAQSQDEAYNSARESDYTNFDLHLRLPNVRIVELPADMLRDDGPSYGIKQLDWGMGNENTWPDDLDELKEMYPNGPRETWLTDKEFDSEADALHWVRGRQIDGEDVFDGDPHFTARFYEQDEDIGAYDSKHGAQKAAEEEQERIIEMEVDSYAENASVDDHGDYYYNMAREELEYERRSDTPRRVSDANAVRHAGHWQSAGGRDYRELVLSVPNIEPYNADDSTHFQTDTGGRTVAWSRFKIHDDANGTPTLFIEELQSQRAQHGKEQGFKGDIKPEGLTAERVEHGGGGFTWTVRRPNADIVQQMVYANSAQEAIARVVADRGVPTAPFVRDTQQWTALLLKRIVRYAADKGITQIAWTTGLEQTERYEGWLRDNVDRIEWKKVEGEIEINAKQRGTSKVERKFSKEELRAAIGSDMAEAIINDPNAEGTLSGDKLTIDDLGMAHYYGDAKGMNPKGKPAIVPIVADKIARALGGEGVETVSLSVREGQHSYDGAAGIVLTPEMIAKVQGGQPLFQPSKKQGGSRGQISFADDIKDRPSIITLLQNADLSTFLHEMGHFQLEVLADIASQEDAPPEIVADMQKLLAWFKPGMTLDEWRAMPLEEKRPYHEQYARGFEAYLFEGRSPNPELNGIFARFRAWLLNVYKQITALNVTLTDEVRGVMDRMLATNEEIQQAEAARNYAPLFKSAEEAGMTPAEWRAYHELALNATQEAVDQLQTRSLRDMQWLQNARGRELKRLQKNAEAKRRAVEAEVRDEVRSQPVYAAQRFLRYGELPEADRTNAERALLDDLAGKPTKLSLPALKEMYGEGPAAPWRYLSVGAGGLAATDGIHPDAIAELFGFTSGDHLVRAILDAQPESAVIEGMTDQRMLERYGDLSSPEAIERAANEAIHNEARTRFVSTELRMLARATGQKNVLIKAAREFAATIIARKRLREIKPAQHAAAEARAAKAAEKALLAKNMPEAAVEKRNQLVNGFATKAAYDALEEIEKGVRYLKRIGDSKTIDPEYREQIAMLLDRFDLRRVTAREAQRRQNLTEWIVAEKEKGNEPVIDPRLLDEAARKPYQDMTLEEFRGLVDAVKNVEHLGRLKHKLLTAQDERAFNARVDEAAASIVENAKRSIPEKLERNRWIDKVKDGATSYFVMHRKLAAMIRELDGWKDGGAMWELFSRPANRAAAREAVMNEQATVRLTELFKGIKGWKEKTFIPAINNSLSREGRIMVALNAGNEGNLQRLMDGDKWSAAQVRAVIDTLEKHEMDFVQGVWDFFEEYRTEIGAQQRRLTGVEPEWVQATPVPTRHGTYKGGYIPVKYDGTRSTRSLSDEAAAGIMDLWRAARGSAKTRDSFTKARADKVVDRPLKKDFGVITQHVTEVTHRLAWQEFLVDAQRLLRAAPIDSAIREHYGHHVLEAMRDTITDIAAGDLPAQNMMETIANHLRTGTSIAMMGWRLTTAMIQFSGFTQSAVRIGPKWIARGLAEFVGDAVRMENTAKRVSEKSDFMRLRGKTLQREVNEILNLVENRNSAIRASYFWMIQKMQMAVDIPTWLGQYHKAIEAGVDEATAVAQADQAVKDSQGGGQIMDLAAVQRGSPYLKLFTNFYSYFNVTFNLTREVVGRTDVKNPISVAKAAADMMLLYTIPALVGTLMYAALEGEDDWEELAKEIVADQVSFLFGTLVGLREIGGVARAALGLPGDYRGPAGVRFLAEVVNLGKQIGQGEVDEAALKAASNTAGILFHLPAGQVNATIDGIHAIATGETEWPGALAVGHRDR